MGANNNRPALIVGASLIVVLTAIFLGLILYRVQPEPPATAVPFAARDLTLDDFHLFDLVTTDIDGDGALDLVTSNHSARQSFLLGDGHGGFGPNNLVSWGLSQSPDFPGLEDSAEQPDFETDGLYVFWRDSQLVLHAQKPVADDTFRGQIEFLTPITVTAISGFEVVTQTLTGGDGLDRTLLDFRANGQGDLIVEPQPAPRVGSPITVTLAAPTDLQRVFVGRDRLSPAGRVFPLRLKDRHGLAWTDLDGDGRPDLLVVRGANLGLAASQEEATAGDEVFFQADGSFRRAAASDLGLSKQGCPARQVGLADVNADNRLDVYITCAREAPNQLWIRQEDGRFVEKAAALGVAIAADGVFAWFDADGDGQTDLFWSGTDGVAVYRNAGNSFERQAVADAQPWVQKLAVGDYDGDGKPDVFAASGAENALYHNTGDGFAAVRLADVGLPAAGLTANWVDYDNDGRLDLHVPPQGLYRQAAPGRFVLEQSFAEEAVTPARQVRSLWFDADNDGRRDVISSLQTITSHQITGQDEGGNWSTHYYRNTVANDNHWLEIVLTGPPGNREAVGATVTLTTPQGQQLQGTGWADGSHFSQGHYRLYFGLGPAAVVDSLVVRWPDGQRQELRDVPADRLLSLSVLAATWGQD